MLAGGAIILDGVMVLVMTAKQNFTKMVKRGFIVNPGKTLKHLIYIDDLCRTFVLAAESNKAAGEVFIIAGTAPLPLRKMIEISARILDVKYSRLIIPASLMTLLCTIVEASCNAINIKPIIFRRSMDFFTKSVACDVSKSKLILGFEAKISPEAGISMCIDYYLENGMLNK